MSIDYVKCFNLVPQWVVLALLLELSMGPRNFKALGAMYEQLHHAFKVLGTLGAWWTATNGMLQGCLLSVTLVNALAAILRWELVEVVHAATAALPPALAEVDPYDLDPGELPCWSIRAQDMPP